MCVYLYYHTTDQHFTNPKTQNTQSLTLEGASDSLLQSVSSLVLAATKDRIPNVRFTAAQVKMHKILKETCVL